jgi:signal transduction histidine kinase
VGQLAGGLAHHLRNNVTGARMAVQLHARECDADPETLTVALRQLTLLEENLKQLLAAPQSACETAVKNDVRLADVVEEVVELVNPSLRHRRISLSVVDRIENRANLPADAGQLRQLLVNLVLNGADAAGPAGRVTIAIETANGKKLVDDPHELRLLPPHIVLRVSDSGPGPAPEIAERLFEPFVTNKPEGIGLGLAVSQQIARSHGGSIFFSRQNGETCVEVHLPLTVSDCRDSNNRPCPIS